MFYQEKIKEKLKPKEEDYFDGKISMEQYQKEALLVLNEIQRKWQSATYGDD